ncbi:flagellar protein FlgN [Noviherbaspirillum sp.]|uniref:flagella synthesis protein FlgN n=1 Tax=Noviherbaspirillum sp. TaxID=1926288 RepID=UPI002D26459A|nr:flagellar protein FlgN [Noviherbaspirillum sp.]HZW20283.1 flagellar protein FlgN [Noviherbaspirillum sp.]
MQSIGNTLAQSLGEEVRAAAALRDLLKQEQDVLINANMDELARLAEEKTKFVVRMTELAQNRHRALASAGFDGSEAGMQKWVDAGAAQSAAGKSWTELLDIAREAKELNRVNGLLIGQHMGRNQAALNILNGAPQGGAMYGPNGQSANTANKRKLVVG